jgi:hypothetical protein
MVENLRIEQDLIEDLLVRISRQGKKGREAALEALAVSTEDDDWRPDELIKQGGIKIIMNLLKEKICTLSFQPWKLLSLLRHPGRQNRLSMKE